jgi:hypothetical protein
MKKYLSFIFLIIILIGTLGASSAQYWTRVQEALNKMIDPTTSKFARIDMADGTSFSTTPGGTTFNGGTITTGLSVPTLDVGTTTRGANNLNIIGTASVSGSVVVGASLPQAQGTSIVRIYKSNQDLTGNVASDALVHFSVITNDNSANNQDKGGAIGMGGMYASNGTNPVMYGAIAGRKENSTDANANGYLTIYTFNSGLKERIRIDSSGKVGINQIVPTAMLHVTGASTSSADTSLRIEDSTNAPILIVRNDKRVGIGTTTPSTDLQVIGTVTVSSGIIVNGSTMNVPDYVFSPEYKLMSLEKLRNYVEINQHLPEFESAKNSKELNLVQDNMKLRESVEKLTLYLFEMKQEIADLRRKIQ